MLALRISAAKGVKWAAAASAGTNALLDGSTHTDTLAGTVVRGDLIVGVLLFVYVIGATWLACQLFAGRAAFLLVGAMLATAALVLALGETDRSPVTERLAAALAERAVERARQLFQADVIGSAELQRRESELAMARAEQRASGDQLKLLGIGQAAIDLLREADYPTFRRLDPRACRRATTSGCATPSAAWRSSSARASSSRLWRSTQKS